MAAPIRNLSSLSSSLSQNPQTHLSFFQNHLSFSDLTNFHVLFYKIHGIRRNQEHRIKKSLVWERMVKFSGGLQRQKTRAEEQWVCEDLRWGKHGFGGERERDGLVGLRERKRGREIRWVWAAMGEGEENFAEKLGLIVCGWVFSFICKILCDTSGFTPDLIEFNLCINLTN